MDLNDLNTAQAEEILIGEQAESQTNQTSDSSAENSQETSEEKEENVEGTDQQVTDENKGETAESQTNDGETSETGEQQEESTEGSEAEGETATEETTEEEKPDPDAILKEVSNGQIESAAALSELLQEKQRLQEELKKPREPEFASDRAKQAYDYLQKHSGEFEELTREAHRVLSIDPEGMNDKELQFEAFALQRKDLSRGDAQRVFELKFDKLFGELEDDPDNVILNDELKVNSIEAKAAITKAQETLQSELAPKEAGESDDKSQEDQAATDQLTPEQIEKVQQDVKTSLNGYDGLHVKLGKEGKEVVNIALNDGQIETLNDAMTNPAELVDAAIAQFGSSDGTFNYDGYRDFITSFIHHDRIVQESFNQGINTGKKMALDGAKNLETKDPPATTESKAEPSFTDAFVGAYQGGK